MLEDPDRRGRVSAVVSIIAAASLPFNYFAANWFRTLHPAKSIRLDGGGVTMDGSMLQALLVNVAAAALIYLFFMVERARVGRLEAQLETEREKTLQSAPQEVIHV